MLLKQGVESLANLWMLFVAMALTHLIGLFTVNMKPTMLHLMLSENLFLRLIRVTMATIHTVVVVEQVDVNGQMKSALCLGSAPMNGKHASQSLVKNNRVNYLSSIKQMQGAFNWLHVKKRLTGWTLALQCQKVMVENPSMFLKMVFLLGNMLRKVSVRENSNLAKAILTVAYIIVMVPQACAATRSNLPPNSIVYMPLLKDEIKKFWPEVQPYSLLAALIEQESCITLKSKRCWNPRVELKTDREYGFGLGQLTITTKFNAWEEVRTMDASMRDWRWEDRYNASYQLRAIVLKNRANYRRVTRMTSDVETQMAFTMAAYNGGLGGLMKDRVVCQNTAGCNPARWFGHVERTSTKSKTAVKGYGKSFFEINREYVRNALWLQPRRAKYVPYMDSV